MSNIEWKIHRLTGGYRPSRRRVRRAAGEFEVAFDDGTAEVVQAWTLRSVSLRPAHFVWRITTEIYRADTENNFNVCG